jgi:DNA-binding XRE family transcriptional regulator
MPSPAEISEARHHAGLTQEQAGAVIGATRRTWQNWENGTRNMPPAKWELFQIKVKQAKK